MGARSIRSSRFAFVDVETTGIDAATCAVVEVAVQIVEGGRVTASFESLVDPGCPIPPFVSAIHGICDDDVRGKPPLHRLVPQLLELCDDAVIVAHNASFDRRFLPFLAHQPSLCSLALARRTVPDAPNYKNQTLAAFFGVRDPALRGRRAHRALADVIVTRHVFFHCVDRYVAAGYPDDLAALSEFVTARIAHQRSA